MNATPLELAWIAIGAAIALLNIWALVDAHRDDHARAEHGRNGLLRIAGAANIWRERGRTSVQLLFAAAGVAAAFDIRAIVLVALFAAQIANGAGALLDRATRRRMHRYDERQRAREDLLGSGQKRRITDRPPR